AARAAARRPSSPEDRRALRRAGVPYDSWPVDHLEAALLDHLEAIDRGEERVILTRSDETEAHYRTSKGWHLTVFVDCGGWDYIDRFTPPGSSRVYDVGANGLFTAVLHWRPMHNERYRVWDWPRVAAAAGYGSGDV
ncbi:MAG TPA: hypothetical protein VFN38_10500, partial [Gemmatimonadaceae bacterium]|nr:hypothetical protein [Gemmatimonadaceae bacterium]